MSRLSPWLVAALVLASVLVPSGADEEALGRGDPDGLSARERSGAAATAG